METSPSLQLRRSLQWPEAVSLVIGTIIGTGIFLKTATMAQLVSSPWVVLAAWAVAGGMSLIGALTYAELGGLFPHAGGEFNYLKGAYGRWVGFLFGWQRFWIGSPGSIAAYGVGSATFLRGVIPMSPLAAALAPVAFILAFTSLNCLAVKIGGRAQAALTALKLLLVMGLTISLLGFSQSGSWGHLQGDATTSGFSWSSFGLAVLSALWAFDGWNNLTMAAGEVENPKRNVPLALVVGVIAVFMAYAAANLAYFYALPLSEIVRASSPLHPSAMPVATEAARTVFGPLAVSLLAAAMVISALGAMNGSILTGSRVPYALASDGLFPKLLARLSPKGHVPFVAVLVQGTWASVLALSGTFDQLTDWVVFSSWIFYGLCAFSVIIYRKKLPNLARSYRVPLFPFLPLAFCGLAILLLINTVVSSPVQSLLGLGFILLGLPVYFWRTHQGKPK